MKKIKFSLLANILVSIILTGQVLFGIFHLFVIFTFLNNLNQKPVTTGALRSFSEKSFKFRLLDAELRLRYEFIKDQKEDHIFILNTNLINLSPSKINSEIYNLKINNIKTRNSLVVPIRQSTFSVPINKEEVVIIFLIYSGVSLIYVLLSILIFWQIKKMLGSINKGTPFVTANVKRLILIGWLVFLIPIIQYLINSTQINLLKMNFQAEGFRLISQNDFNFGLFAGGILLILISGVFRDGVKMKEEQELTI